MTGVARLATELGYKVSGSDSMLLPPMSDQLQALNVNVDDNMQSLPDGVDVVLTANVLSRGQPIVEALLDQQIHYQSAPEWLYQHILCERPVVAIAGTHGKTTTTAMVTWILEKNGQQPGFLMGGVAENFGSSSRLGDQHSPFVIEADEYDTAFFDKRPKFLHYHPNLLVINNLEFDHADIYQDLGAIQTQFHYLLRQLPSQATVIYPNHDEAIQSLVQRGCWSRQVTLSYLNQASQRPDKRYNQSSDWQLCYQSDEIVSVMYQQQQVAMGTVPLIGDHNRRNMIAAIATCHQLGISATKSLTALRSFQGVKRRLQIKGEWQTRCRDSKSSIFIRLIDDFAHHPTAIRFTLKALKDEWFGNGASSAQRHSSFLIALLDMSSNSMKQGAYQNCLADSLKYADHVLVWQNQKVQWDVEKHLAIGQLSKKIHICHTIEALATSVVEQLKQYEQHKERRYKQANHSINLVMLSNGNFGGLSDTLMNFFNSHHHPMKS